MEKLAFYLIYAFAIIVTLTVHEYFHGYAAFKLGDDTAKNQGRLTLNPIKHIDPIGAICMLLFRIGWAKPVPNNPRNFKNPKRDFAITAFAGPLSNLAMSFISAFVFLCIEASLRGANFKSYFVYALVQNVIFFFEIFHILNIGIALFNLIPVPPLDGSRVLGVILPPKTYFGIMRYERIIYYVLLGWLLVGDILYTAVLSSPIVASIPFLASFAKILSLSELLGDAINTISNLFIKFWQLIPFLNV